MLIRHGTREDGRVNGTERMSFTEQHEIRTAAARARRLFPNRVGELVSRELMAYADFGHRFTRDALIPDLAAWILESEQTDHRVRGS
jgi:hypothetical protein